MIWLPEPEHWVAGTARFPPRNIRYEQWHRNKFTSRRDGAIPEINPKIVQEQLGHASIHLTLNTYSHVIKSMRGIAANALEEVVGSD
jgi:integrase